MRARGPDGRKCHGVVSARSSSRPNTLDRGPGSMARPTRLTSPRSPGYLPGLDGLRALAVLAGLPYPPGGALGPRGVLGGCPFFFPRGLPFTTLALGEERAGGPGRPQRLLVPRGP